MEDWQQPEFWWPPTLSTVPTNLTDENQSLVPDLGLSRKQKTDVMWHPDTYELTTCHSESSVQDICTFADVRPFLQYIPKKMSQGPMINNSVDPLLCPMVHELVQQGYFLRLGPGRHLLKSQIAIRLRSRPLIKERCHDRFGMLKRASILQIFQIAEVAGLLTLALRICSDYWRDRNPEKQSFVDSRHNNYSRKRCRP